MSLENSDAGVPQVELPQELIEKFERSGFCPHDAIRGRPETGTSWSTLEIEYDSGSESSYPGTSMFYVCHRNGKTTKAKRPWGEMCGKHDGEFIKAVVDWFQSMTQAKPMILGVDAEARRLGCERLASLKYEDITEEDIDAVEDLVSMGRGAWDMVNHRELILACVKVICAKIA